MALKELLVSDDPIKEEGKRMAQAIFKHPPENQKTILISIRETLDKLIANHSKEISQI